MAVAPKTERASRVAVVSAITTPLAYLVLVLLLVESVIGGLALSLPDPAYRIPLVWSVIITIPAFAATVVALAVFRPEALTGDRPLQRETAQRLADDIYDALEGPLRNLEPRERMEAWAATAEIITSDPSADKTYRRFCETVADRLRQRAHRGVRLTSAAGPGGRIG